MDVAGAVPDHHIVAPGELLYIGAQVAVGPEEDRLLAGDRFDDAQGVGRGAADVRQRLHAHRRVNIGDHRVARVLRLEGGESGRVARLGQRAARLGAWDEHPLVGAEHLGRLGHEVDAGEEDRRGVDALRLDRQGQRVAQKVGHLLHLGRGVVVGQDHGVLFALELLDSAAQRGGVFNHVCFYFLFLY